jgi:hypothetical protein
MLRQSEGGEQRILVQKLDLGFQTLCDKLVFRGNSHHTPWASVSLLVLGRDGPELWVSFILAAQS